MTTTDIAAAIAAVDRYQYDEASTLRDLAPVLTHTPTLGVEVTDPQVDERCDLGNLDPQHGHHRHGPVVPREPSWGPTSARPRRRPRGGAVTAAQAWVEARARTAVAAAVAADAAIDAEDSDVDGEPDYVADAVETAIGALAEAVAAAADALGEPGDAVQRTPHVCVAIAEACAARAADIHRAVCAVDDGTGSEGAVRAAVARARHLIDHEVVS